MTRRTLAFDEHLWAQLVPALDDEVETAWMLLTRIIGDPASDDVTLLVYRMLEIPSDCYDERERDRLSIRNTGWLPAFREADASESVPFFVHTHPGGHATPSDRDLRVDDELSRVAEVRTQLGHYGSLVLGGTSKSPEASVRFRADDEDWRAFDVIRIAGERLMLLPATSGEARLELDIFDRQVRTFGDSGQRLLGALRVGVVGAGGTGSAVLEQLVRLGVKDIVTLDPETLTSSNVTRVYGSKLEDVGRPKVEIAEDHAAAIGLGAAVKRRQGRVLTESVAKELLHCDVVFGCTDDNAGRLILTRLPQALLQILIDCGVVIDSRGGHIFEIFGRVSFVAPTTACLLCMGDIDPVRANAEAMSEEEHQARLREGYAPELDTVDPSVVTYTTIAASFAVNELMSRAFGYADIDPANRILLRVGSRAISRGRRPALGNHRCTQDDLLGSGVQEPFLGYGWQQ